MAASLSTSGYPGCPSGTDPTDGYPLGDLLYEMVTLVRSAPCGPDLSAAQIAATINHPDFRAVFGLGDYRYACVSTVARVHVYAPVILMPLTSDMIMWTIGQMVSAGQPQVAKPAPGPRKK